MQMTSDLHFIRKYILKELTQLKWGRFRDLKPKNVDSNLYNYHLKQLIKDGLVEYVADKGYRLSPTGLRYADHVSFATFVPRWQPKVITALVAERNSEVMMWQKFKQPFVSKLALPSGKMHFEDKSIKDALQRELSYIMKEIPDDIKMAGTIEYSAYIGDDLVTHTIAHIFKCTIDPSKITSQRIAWVDVSNLGYTDMSPGTKETIEAVRKNQGLFFESHTLHW